MKNLFGEEPENQKKTNKIGICLRDYKRNRCSNCGAYPKIHRTRTGRYYCKCHGYCPHWGYDRQTALFGTPQEAVDCWNENNKKEETK